MRGAGTKVLEEMLLGRESVEERERESKAPTDSWQAGLSATLLLVPLARRKVRFTDACPSNLISVMLNIGA